MAGRSAATSRRWSRPISSARACSGRSIRKAFIDKDAATAQRRRAIGDWRVINAQALVTGSARRRPTAGSQVEFRLWDVFAEQQMTGLRYTTTPAELAPHRPHHRRRDLQAHHRRGRLFRHPHRLHLGERARATSRIKRLAIMDQDGANHRFLTDGRALVLTPRFSPTAQEITYLSYRARHAAGLSLQHRHRPAGSARRLPRHDLRAALLARRQQGDHEHRASTATPTSTRWICARASATRLTDNPAIDTSPCYSPDGTQIVFNPTAAASQQIYVMNADGSERAAHQLRRRPLRHAGLVAARRPHRLHQDRRRQLLDRRDAAGRLGRAAADQRLPGRRPDLGAQRPRADVFPPDAVRLRRARAAVPDSIRSI